MGISTDYKGMLVLVTAGALFMWYVKRELSKVGRDTAAGISEIIFGPDLEPDIELTESAEQRQQRYIKLGYLKKDLNGFYRLTPTGKEYIARQQELRQ